MSVEKILEERTLLFAVKNEQPVKAFGGKLMSPHRAKLVIENGELVLMAVFGLIYNLDGRLGKKEGSTIYAEAFGTPDWVQQIMADNNVAWGEGLPVDDEDESA